MKPDIDNSRTSIQSLGDAAAGSGVENVPRPSGPGWSPYEVWFTRVKAVEFARTKRPGSPSPPVEQRRKDKPRNSWLGASRNVAQSFAFTVTSMTVRRILRLVELRRE
jgi:hypothetical protein